MSINVTNLSKTYKVKGGQSIEALKDVSFALPDKGMIFISGRSGSGKTTLLNLLSGMDNCTSGSIEVDRKNIVSLKKSEKDAYRNSVCGFVFQEYQLIPELNVRENIELALQLQGENETDAAVDSALERVDLSGFGERKIFGLSGGQKQRVAIARALVKNPEIIFADEPTGALDFKTGKSVLELLKKLSQDKLVIVVSHDMDFAEEFADGIIELADGEIVRNTCSNHCEEKKERAIEYKQSKLPLKPALKIGTGNFKYHPARMVVTVILSIIAFSLLGISFDMSIQNPTANYVSAVYKGGIEYTSVHKAEYYDNHGTQSWIDNILSGPAKYSQPSVLSVDDVEMLTRFSDTVVPVQSSLYLTFHDYKNFTTEELESVRDKSDKHYTTSADGLMYLSDADIKKLGFTIAGRLPESSEEIAINTCLLNAFAIGGFKSKDGIKPINKAEDIFGCKINVKVDSGGGTPVYRTITGVIDTGCDKAHALSHTKAGFCEKLFVPKGEITEATFVLIPTQSDRNDFLSMSEFIIDSENNPSFFKFENAMSQSYHDSVLWIRIIKRLSLYLSIIFLIFAVVFLANFITASLRSQYKQIGVLFSLGAGFKQICKVYCSGAAVLFIPVFIVSAALSAVGISLLGTLVTEMLGSVYSIITYNPLILLFLALTAIAAVAIGCMLPLLRIAKRTPTEIILEGQIV